LSQTSSPFCSGYFGDGVSRTTCLSWLQTKSLQISVSQVARITDVRHQCLSMQKSSDLRDALGVLASFVIWSCFLLSSKTGNFSEVHFSKTILKQSWLSYFNARRSWIKLMAQVVQHCLASMRPEFKPQYHNKKTQKHKATDPEQ
jgi:hypothetical protein